VRSDVEHKPEITVIIDGDTTLLNEKLEESLKKARELYNLLQQIGITPSEKLN
jgi:hypothetical protein